MGGQRILGVLGVAVLLAGCASAVHTAPPAHSTASLPAVAPLVSDGWVPGQFAMAAGLVGVLRVSMTAAGACAWLGDAGAPQAVSWPKGWTATRTGEVLDETGALVARAGQRVTLPGGYSNEGSTRCATGHVWAVQGRPE